MNLGRSPNEKNDYPSGAQGTARGEKDVTIIDVRRKSDYEADKQVIPGAVWHDPEKAEQWGKDLPKEKDIIIYCVKGGSVSKSVLDRLLEKKVKACYIEGGIIAWKECGGEVTAK